MVEEKISQECRLENIEEINNGFVKEIRPKWIDE